MHMDVTGAVLASWSFIPPPVLISWFLDFWFRVGEGRGLEGRGARGDPEARLTCNALVFLFMSAC